MAAIGTLSSNSPPTSKSSSQHQDRDTITIGIKSRMVEVVVKIVLAAAVEMVSTNRLSRLEELVGQVRSPHLRTILRVVVEIIECASRAAVVGLMVAATRVVVVREVGPPLKILDDKAVIRTIDAPTSKVKIT